MAEVLAATTCIILGGLLDERHQISFFNAMLVMGGVPLLYYGVGNSDEDKMMVAGCVIFIAYGAYGTMCSLYLAHPKLFPVIYRTTTIGFCNIASRFVSILAPIIAEQPVPFPQRTLLCLSLIALLVSFTVEKKT